MKVRVINSNGFVHKGEVKKLNEEFEMTKEEFKALSINTKAKFLKVVEKEAKK